MKYLLMLLTALCISCAHTCPCKDDITRIEIELNEHKDLPSYERLFLLQGTIEIIKMEKKKDK